MYIDDFYKNNEKEIEDCKYKEVLIVPKDTIINHNVYYEYEIGSVPLIELTLFKKPEKIIINDKFEKVITEDMLQLVVKEIFMQLSKDIRLKNCDEKTIKKLQSIALEHLNYDKTIFDKYKEKTTKRKNRIQKK